jgi:hypothetical protein
MENINFANLVECCEKRTNRNFEFCPAYAEPGYSHPEKGIVFGNWNPACGFLGQTLDEQRIDPVSKLARVLEANGFELEWSDEWTTCCDCGKAVRQHADSYFWTPYFRVMNDCELVCLGCLDPEDYLVSIEDDADKACPPEWNPEDYGYAKFNGDFETGFHPGQNDKPSDILKKMHGLGMSRIVFKIAEQSQFYVTWQAYHKTEENS